MEHMLWVLVTLLAVVAFWQFSASRSAYRKLNTLNEYVQFLLFQPEVYEDNRQKFLTFVSQNSSRSIADQAMASYQAIESVALQLEDKILLANVKMRGSHDDST